MSLSSGPHQNAVKLISRSSLAALTTGAKDTLFRVYEAKSGRTFLIDPGARVSVLPKSKFDISPLQTGPKLFAANQTVIQTYGARFLPLHFGKAKFEWEFIIADVAQPIIGSDFLRSYGLLIDFKNGFLIKVDDSSGGHTHVCSELTHTSVTAPRISKICSSNPFSNLLFSNPALITPSFNLSEPTHGIYHRINTVPHHPWFAKVRRVSPEHYDIIKNDFEKLEKAGIVRRSDSCYSSALHLVDKPDKTKRHCIDFRPGNLATIMDRYPLPRLHDFSRHLHDKVIFSKIDLYKGFHQIPVLPEDIPKTAVATPVGLFEWVRMPFGLKNAAQTFQRLMDTVCRELDFIFVYLDDILVASRSPAEHEVHLKTLFDRLLKHGLVVNPDKCVLGASEIEFLGHLVTRNSISPLPSKIADILKMKKPTTVKLLQGFTGSLNFYFRFIPWLSETLIPLFQATANQPGSKKLDWTEEMSSAFQKSKDNLANHVKLAHPNPKAQLSLSVDASEKAVGGVLQQKEGGVWKPLGFFSKALRNNQKKWSAFDRELLAAKIGVTHFKHLLAGREFTLFTDHRPLIHAFKKQTTPQSARQARHMAVIAEYTSDIQHVSGEDNIVADYFSRIEVDAITVGVDFKQLSQAQAEDQDLQLYKSGKAMTSLQLQEVPFHNNEFSVWCDVSRSKPRPIVPKSLRKLVFDSIHGLSHPGVKASRRMITDRFVWHKMATDIGIWARCCIACQKSKTTKHVKAPIEQIEVPPSRFEHIHCDLVGPLEESNGNTYVFTIIDRFCRWPEAIPLPDMETPTVARAFLLHWLARFGMPIHVTHDRGSQFTSQLFKAMCELLGIHQIPTTSYHPQSNGLIERVHRPLKDGLKAREADPNWSDHLPWILLGLRAAPKEHLDTSPADLVYGQPLVLPAEFLGQKPEANIKEVLDRLREKVGNFKPIPTSNHNTKALTYVPKSLKDSKFVFIRRGATHTQKSSALRQPYEGPFKVITTGDKYFEIQRGTQLERISIDRLKPAELDPDEEVKVAIPPSRGRPRKQPQNSDTSDFSVNQQEEIAETPSATSDLDFRTTSDLIRPTTTRSGRTTKVPEKLKHHG